MIPTFKREPKLNRLLLSILDSKIQMYEIIVVDDSQSPTRIDERVYQSLGQRFRYIHNSPRRFISTAKNIGWRAAGGEYIFFVDDDNVLPEDTAGLLSEELDRDQKIGALMPAVYYEKRRQLVWVYSAPFQKGRWKFNLIGRNTTESQKPKELFMPTDALPNASMVRKKILEEIGGLDEKLPINSSCDLCQRIKARGYGAYAFTGASIFHDVSLPDIQGYWAEHASEDYVRRYYEVRDWFDLMSRIHRNEELLALKEFIRAFSFLVPVSAGILLHPTRRKQSLRLIYSSMLRGVIDGVKVVSSRRVQ